MALQVVLEDVRVAFLVGHIVRALINRGDGNGAYIRGVKVARRAIRHLTTSTAPTNSASTYNIGREMLAYRILSTSYLVFANGNSSFSVGAFTPFTSAKYVNAAILSTSCSVPRIYRMLIPWASSTPCVLRNNINEFSVSVGCSQVFFTKVGICKFSRPYVRFRFS